MKTGRRAERLVPIALAGLTAAPSHLRAQEASCSRRCNFRRNPCVILRRMSFATIPKAIEEIRSGRMLVVVDDEDRENEGDLTIAAQFVTPEAINFMAVHGRGLICLPLAPERCDALHLPLVFPLNTSRFGTAFCESIDAVDGVTTGISAADRAHTILTAIRPGCPPRDLARPGHVFPLRAREGGVLVRAGQTEAAVDLARLAGLEPGGVICEIMNEDGTMARVPQLIKFCEAGRMVDHDLRRQPHPLSPPRRTLSSAPRRRLPAHGV